MIGREIELNHLMQLIGFDSVLNRSYYLTRSLRHRGYPRFLLLRKHEPNNPYVFANKDLPNAESVELLVLPRASYRAFYIIFEHTNKRKLFSYHYRERLEGKQQGYLLYYRRVFK